jgi:hypothetical protein
MKIIALEREGAGESGNDYDVYLRAEAQMVWDLAHAGIVREIHFREDRPQAVIILEAAGVDEAREILSRLPLVEAGLIEFEIIGLRPYPGYERLFAR